MVSRDAGLSPHAVEGPSTGSTASSLGDDPVLNEIVRRLVEALHPEYVYLFGSRARGDAAADSDYDLLLIIDTPRDRIYQLRTDGHGAMFGVGASVDILVMTPEYFRGRLNVVASLPATVRREGKLLYAA
ncbi:MAG: nucleotidyltransferase domain-containing protein [Chloroflexota bacterium]